MRLLNVGGGTKKTPIPEKFAGWDHILLDIQDGPDVDINVDTRDAFLMFNLDQRHTFDAVYCAHNLEHYFDHDLSRVFAAFKRALKPGGEVCIVVPNLGQLICDMIEMKLDLEDILYQSDAGPITPLDVIFGFRKEIEESGKDYYAHKTGFTAKRLHDVLKKAGFQDIEIMADFPRLELVGIGRSPGGDTATDGHADVVSETQRSERSDHDG